MTHPYKIPGEYSVPQVSAEVEEAYDLGLNAGHGLACQNVPKVGEEWFTEFEGRQTVTEDNIRDIHFGLCYEAEEHARCYSPFEVIASSFNYCEEEFESEDRWEAYDAGVQYAIVADIDTYTDEDYGIEADEETL